MPDFRYTAELDDEILDAVLGYASPGEAYRACTVIANRHKIGRTGFNDPLREFSGDGYAHAGKPVWNRVWDIAISDGVYTGPSRPRTRRPAGSPPTGVEAYVLATAHTARGPTPPAACVTPPTSGYLAHVLARPVEWVIDQMTTPANAAKIMGHGAGFGL